MWSSIQRWKQRSPSLAGWRTDARASSVTELADIEGRSFFKRLRKRNPYGCPTSVLPR
jgi:hypothetical protein